MSRLPESWRRGFQGHGRRREMVEEARQAGAFDYDDLFISSAICRRLPKVSFPEPTMSRLLTR